VSITVAYITAFGLSYLLNRVFTFRSHGAVGRWRMRGPVHIRRDALAGLPRCSAPGARAIPART